MRRAAWLFGIVLLVAGLAAAVARADGGTGTTTTDTTTTATTTTTSTTTTTTAPTYTPVGAAPLPHRCVGAGVAAIASPNGVVAVMLPRAGLGASEYSSSNPFLTFDSAAVTGSGCSNDRVTVTNL